MKIIEGLEAIIGNNFTGRIVFVFSKDSEIKEYTVEALDGKLLFANEDFKKHFITTIINQSLLTISFKQI